MERENRFNWKIRVATLSVFILGFIAGALSLNAYHVWFGPASQPTKQQRFERVLDQVKLSEIQKADVQKIMTETREEFKSLKRDPDPQVEAIRGRADEKLKKVFTPEQWEKFQQLREEWKNSEKNKK